MKKIALVGLYHENNLGDPLMVEYVEYMYKKIAEAQNEDIEFEYVDLFGRKSKTDFYYYTDLNLSEKIVHYFLGAINRSVSKFNLKQFNRIEYIRWKTNPNKYKRHLKYFREKLKDVDLVVIVWGALVKYKLIRNFHNPMHTLIEVADEYGINVYFNAVGIEKGYDISDFGCRTVKDYLNYSNIKMFTTSDDIETLNNI